MARSPKRLLVVSHVMHYRHDGKLFAYGPYSREIDIWADLFDQIVIASPCSDAPPPGDCLEFTRANITIEPQMETGGTTRAAKLNQIRQLPRLWRSLRRAMRGADAVHVRCPGNLGLLGAAMAPLFSRYMVAKYAGQWNGYEGEARTIKLQRKLLASRWWRGPVTVYGHWPDQPPHVIGFFTSMMTGQQVEHAAQIALDKKIEAPLRVFFSGMLEARKRADVLLDAVQQARAAGLSLEVVLAGDGSERDALHRQAKELGIEDIVTFVGALPFEEALTWYEWAHCLVLPSQHSEGWPKVVAEAMCYGCLAIAVDHGHVPKMLEGRGVVLPHGSAPEIAAALREIADDPARFQPMMRAASVWSREYSLEGLRDSLSQLLTREWGVPVPASTRNENRAASKRAPDASTRTQHNDGALPARAGASGAASTRTAENNAVPAHADAVGSASTRIAQNNFENKQRLKDAQDTASTRTAQNDGAPSAHNSAGDVASTRTLGNHSASPARADAGDAASTRAPIETAAPRATDAASTRTAQNEGAETRDESSARADGAGTANEPDAAPREYSQPETEL